MSKASELNDARLQGMQYALNQIKSNGIEAFEKEMKWRAGRKIGVNISQQELLEASVKIKSQCYDTIRAMSMLVLIDEFGFGKKRLHQYNDRYNLKTECLSEGFATWDDYIGILEDTLGEKFEERWNQ